MVLQDRYGLKLNHVLLGEQLEEVDKFSYFGNYISLCGRASEEVSSYLQKIRLTLASLRHMWCRYDIQLSIKSRVNAITGGSILLYGYEP